MAGYKKKAKILEEILQFFPILFSKRDLKDIFLLTVEKAKELLNADRATLYLYEEDTKELFSYIAIGLTIREIRLPVGVGVAGWVVEHMEPVIINDAYNDPRFNKEVDRQTGYTTKTIICCPLKDSKNRPLGAIQVLNKKIGSFTHNDLEILELFREVVSLILENNQLLYENEAMISSFFTALAAAIDARDPVTSGHSLRVAKYSVNFAKALNYPPDKVKTIEYAGLLHDIGKIGVQDSILLKPGILTPQEYAIMKLHATKTREILEKIYLPRHLKGLVEYASSHHERLDGSGYPRGLKGDNLPEEARILCISDVFDALISYDRPYKRAMSFEEAKVILESSKGTLFDPKLVDLFFEKKLYIIDIREFQRVDANFSIEYVPFNDILAAFDKKLTQQAQTINISPGGLLFKSQKDIPVGTYLNMVLHKNDISIPVMAKATRSEKCPDNTFAIGVRFVNLEKSVQERIQKYLTPEV
ncbi:MAG: HD domain-containing phosphohydrolase [Planctomycetota bacterium]